MINSEDVIVKTLAYQEYETWLKIAEECERDAHFLCNMFRGSPLFEKMWTRLQQFNPNKQEPAPHRADGEKYSVWWSCPGYNHEDEFYNEGCDQEARILTAYLLAEMAYLDEPIESEE